MLHGDQALERASSDTLSELTERGGEGGWIALTPAGEVAATFNTPGMYRGWVDAAGRVTVRIFRD
jgi:beta-aspartyl-peptidase (threonine type)